MGLEWGYFLSNFGPRREFVYRSYELVRLGYAKGHGYGGKEI